MFKINLKPRFCQTAVVRFGFLNTKIMQTSIEMLIDALTKNIVPTTEADQEDLARNGAFYIAITTAKVFQQREKDLILSAFDSKFKGTAEEFYNACFNAKVCKFVKWKRNNPTQLSKQFSKLKND